MPIATREEFADGLDALRQKAGLTIRQLAKEVGAPPGTIGGYCTGRHLPTASQTDLFVKILKACGVGDPEIGLWVDALVRVRRPVGRRPVVKMAPYRGLESFQPEDAEWFFGREEVTKTLVGRVVEPSNDCGLLMVVGPSGAGKSSLLRAGLVSALGDQESQGDSPNSWRCVLVSPGARPLRALADRLADVLGADVDVLARDLRTQPAECAAAVGRNAASRLVVVVDQFEEIFTLCAQDDERRTFVAALCALTGIGGQADDNHDGARALTRVVIGMRADFYASALRYPQLAEALQKAQVVVRPMSESDLRRAIVEPARKAKIDLEDGLVELLLREFVPVERAEQGEGHDAGALPLLSHTLLVTWERGRRSKMTVAAYRASGGIAGAVSQTAEALYAELTPSQQDAARRLFLRLVHVAEDTADTRRQVDNAELVEHYGARERADIGQVIDRYVERRLITVDAETVEISHEALIVAWPRLRAWIDADRVGLRTHRHLTVSARAWRESNRDSEALYRGGRLAAAAEWANDQGHRGDLNALEQEFLDASIEQDLAEQISIRRRTRRLQQLLAVLAALSLLVGLLAIVAVDQRSRAQTERDLAISRQVAITADRLRGTDPALAAQLALTAYRISPTVEARSSLVASSGAPMVTRMVRPTGARQAVTVSQDGRLLAAADASETAESDRAVLLWDLSNPKDPHRIGNPLTGHTKPVYAAAFSPDGHTLATGGADSTIRLWNVANPAKAAPIGELVVGPRGRVLAVEFSPDGTMLAAGSGNMVRLWNITDPRRPTALDQPLVGAQGAVSSVAFRPDGRILAAADAAGAAHLWDIRDPHRPRPIGAPLAIPGESRANVATFSPDGALLAVGSHDQMVRLWRVSDTAPPTPVGKPWTAGTGWVNALDFSSDGNTIAVGDASSTVQLWDWKTRRMIATLPHPEPVTFVAYRHDDQLLITNSADGIARAWTVPGPVAPAADRTITTVSLHPSGQLLATSGDNVQLAEIPDHNRNRLTPVGSALTAPPWSDRMGGPVAISPDQRTLVASTRKGNAILVWDITNPHQPTRIGDPLTGPTALIEYLAFSPDQRLLAATSDDGTVRLWDVIDPRHPTPLATLDSGDPIIFEVAFSPDSKIIAAATSFGTVMLWNIEDPDQPKPIGSPIVIARETVYAVKFSPNGHILAAGSADGAVRLWDVTNPHLPTPLSEPATGLDGYVHTVAFSPNGQFLAAGKKGQIWIWNVSNPQHPQLFVSLNRARNSVWSLVFSPDGHTLAAATSDLMLWETDPERIATQICATAGDTISETEWKKHLPDITYRPACP